MFAKALSMQHINTFYIPELIFFDPPKNTLEQAAGLPDEGPLPPLPAHQWTLSLLREQSCPYKV